MMTSSSLLTLIFLLLTITIKLKFVTAGGSVKDTDGNVLNITSEYLILPDNKDGGAVAVAWIKKQLAVVLSSDAVPVTFTDSNTTKTTILTDDIVSIDFTTIPNYNGATSWIVVYDESTHESYVDVGSGKHYPAVKTGNFKIESVGAHYKLVFCSDTKNSTCKDVGVDHANGENRRLALNGNALLIKFKKNI